MTLIHDRDRRLVLTLATLAALLPLAACGPSRAPGADSAGGTAGASATAAGASAASPMRAEGPAYVFACPDGFRFSARVRGDTAIVTLPSEVLTLTSVPAASGTRYEGNGATFWSKGDSALVETADVKQASCAGRTAATPWDEARLLGIEFRGVGQEPGWIVDVDDGRWLRYVGDYGATRRFATIDGATRDTVVHTFTYAVQADGEPLTVTIREGTCQDAMSGEAFTHVVTVKVGGRELSGCGRALPTDDVVGRYWRLVELDGQPAVTAHRATGAREPHLRLRGDGTQASGGTGCNTFRGRVELRGASLTFGPLASTRMACADTAASRQERDYLRALESVTRAAVSGDTLSLFGAQSAVARYVVVPLR